MSGNRIDFKVLDDDLFLPPTLEELIFSDIINLSEKGIVKMKRLKNLRNLDMRLVANMDYERFFSAVKLLTHLRKLNLGGVRVCENDLFDMLSSLPILEEIVFPDVDLTNTDCMTGYFSSLESLRYLKNLDLRYTDIYGSGALARVLPSLLEKLVLG